MPDIVLTPMLAFDRTGHRIGYGGGYYDATLTALSERHRFRAIGVAFSFQEVEMIPAEVSDYRLQAVITEQEVKKF